MRERLKRESMIEIVFSDSACGSLKIAQRYGGGKYPGGAIGIIINHADGSRPTKRELMAARREAEKKERLAWENAAPLGGNPADVYGFHLALSIGDIAEAGLGDGRRRVLEWLWSIYPNDEGCSAAQELFCRMQSDLETVRGRTAAGEPLRIWYSQNPDELCGLYWLMAQLEASSGQVTLVELPEWEVDENENLVERSGWGEVGSSEWHRYLALEKAAPPAFALSCREQWKRLQQENAPLRAVLNGQLASVPETLYDGFILREIAAVGPVFQEARVIGKVLGNYKLKIGDAWIALRIEEMIRAGMLEAVEEAAKDSPIYHRMLRKCGGDEASIRI